MTYYRVENMMYLGQWLPAWFAPTASEASDILEKQQLRHKGLRWRIVKVSDDVFDGTNRLKVKEVRCD